MEENIEDLVASGFNRDVAEALGERLITPEQAKHLSAEELMDHYLEWNGIIGYTSQIINALDNIRNMEAM